MKSRAGFVSNSSSCSFVVKIIEDKIWRKLADPDAPDEDLRLISEELEKEMLDYGFKYSKWHMPEMVEWGTTWRSEEPKQYMAISDACNGSFIIAFLAQRNIPFRGIDHYGHESVALKAGDDRVFVVRNPGIEYNTYDRIEEAVLRDLVTVRHVNEYKDKAIGFCHQDYEEEDED